jgi:hypothetical protein
MSTITESDMPPSQTSETADERPRIQRTIKILRTLLETDAQEQRETFEYLKQALDEDRPSNRRLFP